MFVFTVFLSASAYSVIIMTHLIHYFRPIRVVNNIKKSSNQIMMLLFNHSNLYALIHLNLFFSKSHTLIPNMYNVNSSTQNGNIY